VVEVEEVQHQAAVAVVLDPADGKVASPELERSQTERRLEASRLLTVNPPSFVARRALLTVGISGGATSSGSDLGVV